MSSVADSVVKVTNFWASSVYGVPTKVKVFGHTVGVSNSVEGRKSPARPPIRSEQIPDRETEFFA